MRLKKKFNILLLLKIIRFRFSFVFYSREKQSSVRILCSFNDDVKLEPPFISIIHNKSYIRSGTNFIYNT